MGDIWVVDSNAEAFDIAVGKDVEVHVIVLTGQVFKPEYQSLSEPVFEAGLDYAGLASLYWTDLLTLFFRDFLLLFCFFFFKPSEGVRYQAGF